LQERINATTVGQMMNTIGFGLALSALALGSFVEQINNNDNSIMMDNQYPSAGSYVGLNGETFTSFEQADEYYTSIYGENWQEVLQSSGTDKGIVDGATIDGKNIGDMTKQEIIDSVPDTWEIHDNNGFVHIKDESGKTIIEIHPPDKVTNYEHIHIYDELGNSLDINGVPRFYKDIEVHIPLKRD